MRGVTFPKVHTMQIGERVDGKIRGLKLMGFKIIVISLPADMKSEPGDVRPIVLCTFSIGMLVWPRGD